MFLGLVSYSALYGKDLKNKGIKRLLRVHQNTFLELAWVANTSPPPS